MPTFTDHNADANEAHQAVRALAHATIRFDHDDERLGPLGRKVEHPEDSYWVLGDVLAIVRSLSQVAQQLGAVHTRNTALARTDDGDPLQGQQHVDAVHRAVLEAVFALDRAHECLNLAMSHSGKIAWQQSEPTAPAPEPVRRVRPTVDTTKPNPLAPFGTTTVRLAEPDGPQL